MLHRKIGDVAHAAGLPSKTVRYYADIGLVTPLERSETGYRLYGPKELDQLRFVRRARSLGFSIEACRELLDLYRDGTRSSADVKELARRRLLEIDAKLTELNSLRTELNEMVSACRGDSDPDCPILTRLSAQDAEETS